MSSEPTQLNAKAAVCGLCFYAGVVRGATSASTPQLIPGLHVTTEPVVNGEANEIHLLTGLSGDSTHDRQVERECGAAKISIEVFDTGGLIVGKGVFYASADRPAYGCRLIGQVERPSGSTHTGCCTCRAT
jgi:hypothetical protein